MELLRHLLAALVLRIARLPTPHGSLPRPATTTGDTFLRFQHELEHSFATTRNAADYATRVGYSLPTLNRACQAATGRNAKTLIDARVALEAGRLLAHTDLPVAAIGRRLGFTEPTNFGKFFTRETGLPPVPFAHNYAPDHRRTDRSQHPRPTRLVHPAHPADHFGEPPHPLDVQVTGVSAILCRHRRRPDPPLDGVIEASAGHRKWGRTVARRVPTPTSRPGGPLPLLYGITGVESALAAPRCDCRQSPGHVRSRQTGPDDPSGSLATRFPASARRHRWPAHPRTRQLHQRGGPVCLGGGLVPRSVTAL
ncbi:AraC-like DNA-binding protein [Streptomyces sp. MAA16]|nr:AraC-like DNA-binding protein [Streptomyces sp. MAA16]